MSDLVNAKIGSVGDVKLSFNEGKLVLAAEVGVTIDELLSLIENAIPGDVDNKLIDGLKAIIAKV